MNGASSPSDRVGLLGLTSANNRSQKLETNPRGVGCPSMNLIHWPFGPSMREVPSTEIGVCKNESREPQGLLTMWGIHL